MSDARDDDAETGLRVRPYALTGGRTRSSHDLPIETIVRTSARGFVQQPRLTLERKRIVTLCAVRCRSPRSRPTSKLALGVARVLVGDMTDEGLLDSHATPASKSGNRPDIKLLERVLDGLQAL